MIGITHTNIRTATVEDLPIFLYLENSSSILTASKLVSKSPLVLTYTISNALRTVITIYVPTTIIVLLIYGTTIDIKIFNSDAPSICPASIMSVCIDFIPAEKTQQQIPCKPISLLLIIKLYLKASLQEHCQTN